MKAEEMFKQYKSMCKELSMTAYEISHFTGISQEDIIEVLTFIRFDDETGHYKSTSRRTEDIALISKELTEKKNQEWLQYLLDRYQYLDDEISFFEYSIRQMGEKKADILFELIDGDLTWDQIADAYHVSRSLLGVYRKQAIKEIDRCYAMRDQMQADFESRKRSCKSEK
jgi:hypothetical protein